MKMIPGIRRTKGIERSYGRYVAYDDIFMTFMEALRYWIWNIWAGLGIVFYKFKRK